MRGQFVVEAVVERDGAGDETEGFADGAVVADVDVDGVEGGVDDVGFSCVHLGRLAEEVVDVAFVPRKIENGISALRIK